MAVLGLRADGEGDYFVSNDHNLFKVISASDLEFVMLKLLNRMDEIAAAVLRMEFKMAVTSAQIKDLINRQGAANTALATDVRELMARIQQNAPALLTDEEFAEKMARVQEAETLAAETDASKLGGDAGAGDPKPEGDA